MVQASDSDVASLSSSEVALAPNGVHWLPVPGWMSLDWLWHGFSTRVGGVSTAYIGNSAGGELNLGFTAHDPAENVRENRDRFVEAVTGSRDTPLVTLRQVHSCQSLVIEEPRLTHVGTGSGTIEADGLMTGVSGLLLGIQTADCIPVLVTDPARRAVAGFHAGWRGTVQRIVELGIAKMQTEFGSNPEDLIAAIGPGIGQCCYAVGAEVRERFEADFPYASELFASDGNALHLDLIEANRRQLLAAGLEPGSISVVGGCTACQPAWFFSYRASGGHAGRMMAVIGIR